MSLLIDLETLIGVLREAREQDVSVSIMDKRGNWSDKIFEVEEIKQFRTNVGESVVAFVLHSTTSMNSTVVDVKSIAGVGLNGLLVARGDRTDDLLARLPEVFERQKIV